MRQAEIGEKNIKLKHFTEVYTSEHWMVRIYKLKELDNRGDFMRARATYIRKSPETLQKYGLSTPKVPKPKPAEGVTLEAE